jgi:PAS domain S-box-containing protein
MTQRPTTSPMSRQVNNSMETPESFSDGRACFRELLNQVNLFAVMFNSKAEITYCNDYFSRVTGWSVAELIGRRWYDVFVPPWGRDLSAPFSLMFKNKQHAWNHVSDLLTSTGERHWVRWNSMNLRDRDGALVGAASIGEDISERRHVERALLDSEARERRNMQSELHDGLGQELFGIALLAKSVATSVSQSNSAAAEDLARLSQNASAAIETCRRISRGLSPLSEMQGGLILALQQINTMPTNESGPSVELSVVQDAPLRLSAEFLDHLYRLAQEGITNALRHAQAKSIRVLLNVQPATVTLEIIDDGIGLPKNIESSPGIGLKLMRYRANLLRAHLHVSLGSPRGTHLFFRCEQ